MKDQVDGTDAVTSSEDVHVKVPIIRLMGHVLVEEGQNNGSLPVIHPWRLASVVQWVQGQRERLVDFVLGPWNDVIDWHPLHSACKCSHTRGHAVLFEDVARIRPGDNSFELGIGVGDNEIIWTVWQSEHMPGEGDGPR